MEHLFSAWNQIAPLIHGHVVILFLDYDGTLTRIVRNPEQAKLSAAQKNTLRALAKADQIKTAIVSGRALSDLKKRVGIEGLVYAGNHGLEFEGPKIRFVHPDASAMIKLLERIARNLEEALNQFPGVIIENKGLTVSVHYRKLKPNKVNEAESIFRTVLESFLRASLIRTTAGKKVWEVRAPVKWNKGTTVLWLLT